MKKKLDSNVKTMIAILSVIALFLVSSTFAVFSHKKTGSGEVALATWDVSLNQNGVNNSLTIVSNGVHNEDYTLNVHSNAQVDIRYSIVISNLPNGVEVDLDNENDFKSPPNNSNTVSFADVGTILYSDSDKTNTHTLTFRAASNATPVNNQTVTIDVIVKQIIS